MRFLKLLIPMVMLVLISYIVFAAPPVTEIFTGTTGFEIEFTPIHILKQNEAFTFNFHVFNLTGGQQLVAGIGCTFSLFNSIGEHPVVIYEDDTAATGDHFEFFIGGGNFSDIGDYAVLVTCNSSTEGGFVAESLEITESGSATELEQVLVIVGITLASILFIFGVFFKDPNIGIASGMIFVIVGIHLFRFGYIGINNFISDSIAMIIIGIGSYILFRASVEYLNEADEG